MAISALDVRAPAAPPWPAVLQPVAGPAAQETVLEHAPAPVLAVAALGLLEAVAIVAAALAALGRMLGAEEHLSGTVITLVLVSLAAWVVLCAGSGAGVLDGTGRRLFTAVSTVELAAVAALLLVSLVVPLPAGLTGGVPVPIAALLAIALPAGKLLLAGADSTMRWVAQGPRPRERRIDPVAAHPGLCIGTLAVVGLVLGAVALLGPTAAPAPGAGQTAASALP